jgi:hypothetical protein
MDPYMYYLVNQAQLLLAKKYVSDDTVLNLRRTNYWDLIKEIKAHRSDAIRLGHDMLSKRKSYERFFGISLLGQICNPVQEGEERDAEMIIRWLSDMVGNETSIISLSGIANALGYPYRRSAEPALLKLSENTNDDVRWQATVSLGSVITEEPSVRLNNRLMALSVDKDPDVRDWATMHLGSIEPDSEEIRKALVARTTDRHFDTRSEAIHALADKNDDRGIAPLIKRLSGKRIGRLDFISAGRYGLPEFQPLLKLQEDEPFTGERYLIEWAIKRCDPDQSIKDCVDDEWLSDEWYLNTQNFSSSTAENRDASHT